MWHFPVLLLDPLSDPSSAFLSVTKCRLWICVDLSLCVDLWVLGLVGLCVVTGAFAPVGLGVDAGVLTLAGWLLFFPLSVEGLVRWISGILSSPA